MFEVWASIEDFPEYEVSNTGIVRRFDDGRIIHTTTLGDGSIGVKLSRDGKQHQHLIRRLVAEAFVIPENHFCDSVIHRDGDKSNCHRDNLVWRPRWFCWKYARQFLGPVPHGWTDYPVRNRNTGAVFSNVMEASYTDATLCEEVYRSAMVGRNAFPNIQYEFVQNM